MSVKFVAESKQRMDKDLSTEAKIREAARRVFIAKGFDGCSSREIAEEAGMNVALVNYYFRSKGQLFQLIFQAALEDFLLSMLDVFSTDLSLENKTRIFIEREYDFLTKHPELPGFIINELSRSQGCPWDKADIHERILDTGIFEECLKAQAEGKMRQVDLASITMILMSNCQFPFLARPLVQGIFKMDDAQYDNQLVLHKQFVTEMMINYLFPKQGN
jgi:TetR/AcrR family transcriptional regulator